MFNLEKTPDKEYFAKGNIFEQMLPAIDSHEDLTVSCSFLKQVLKSNLYHYLLEGNKPIDSKLQAIFNIGSAFHCYILEHDEFYDRYYISDVPDPNKDLVRIATHDFEFIETSYTNIEKKYPHILDNELCEVALFGEIDGVKVKCKIDKLIITKDTKGNWIKVEIVDLKSVYFDPFKLRKDATGRWELRKQLMQQDYDLQMYFYVKLVEAWLQQPENNIFCDVEFSILTASKETYEIQSFVLGEEMFNSGKEKFDRVWNEVKDFSLNSKDVLLKQEIL